MPALPEQQARQTIDAMLAAAVCAVQDYKAFDPSASTGIALREVPLKSGRCDYLLTALLTPGLHNHITKTAVGSGVQHLRVRDVESLPTPLPPHAEQTRIVAEVERRLSVVEELEAVVTTNLQRATRLRQAILQQALKGELVRT